MTHMLPNCMGNCAQRHTYIYIWWRLLRFKLSKCGPLWSNMKHLLLASGLKLASKEWSPGPVTQPMQLITTDFSSFVSQRRQVLPKLDTYCFHEYPISLEKGRFPDHKQIDKTCFGTTNTYYFTFWSKNIWPFLGERKWSYKVDDSYS
jgi:hypothetical protein